MAGVGLTSGFTVQPAFAFFSLPPVMTDLLSTANGHKRQPAVVFAAVVLAADVHCRVCSKLLEAPKCSLFFLWVNTLSWLPSWKHQTRERITTWMHDDHTRVRSCTSSHLEAIYSFISVFAGGVRKSVWESRGHARLRTNSNLSSDPGAVRHETYFLHHYISLPCCST